MLRIKQFNATFSKHKNKQYKYCCTIKAVHHNLRYDGYANTKKQALYNAYNSYVNVRANYNVIKLNKTTTYFKQQMAIK